MRTHGCAHGRTFLLGAAADRYQIECSCDAFACRDAAAAGSVPLQELGIFKIETIGDAVREQLHPAPLPCRSLASLCCVPCIVRVGGCLRLQGGLIYLTMK